MTPEQLLEPIIIAWVCCVGACVGSFLNVVVYRLPRRCLSVLRPSRSFCPRCRRGIRWHENIPILSWLALRARCAGCRQPISARYPLVELLTLLLFGWLAWRDLSGRIADPVAWGLFTAHATFGCALLVSSLIDLELRILPDAIDVPGIVLGPLAVALLPSLLASPPPPLADGAAWLALRLDPAFAWWGLAGALSPLEALARLPATHPEEYLRLAAFSGSLLGAAWGAGVVWALGVVFTRAMGRDAMGLGDVKYMAMIGALAGWQGVLVTLMVACVAGAAGGLVYMVVSGRGALAAEDLGAPRSLLGRWGVGLAVAGEPGPDGEVPLRPGTAWIARLLTGDPYVPFGPFLSIGAFVAVFLPGLLFGASP